jgi:hypothetical protein
MEIHAPEGHVQSLRDIAIHLAIVTAGILIALGLEQTVEWYHHRQLVSEGRENILNEIRDNKKELDKQVGMLPRFRDSAVLASDFVTDLLNRGKSDIKRLNLNLYQAQLSNTSWATAQTVGALGFMPYADVKKYAAVYRLQEDYLVAQNRTEEVGVGAYSVFAARNRFEKLSHTELETERSRLQQFVSSLTVQIQQARGLSRAYDRVLSGKAESSTPSPADSQKAVSPKKDPQQKEE